MTGRQVLISVLLGMTIAMGGCGGPAERKAAYTAKAQQYIEEANFPKARVALRNVLKIDPKDAEAYFLIAQVEEREKNWRNAFANYLKVTELDPRHRGALIKLGKFYLEGRAFEKVNEVAGKLAQANPNDVAGETFKAAVVAMQGDLEGATKQAESIVARAPTDPDAAILLATLYLTSQQAAPARAALVHAVDAHPKDIALLNNLGVVLTRLGDLDQAEQTFARIVEAEPRVFDHRARLASFYDYAKRTDRAEAVLREAVRLDPESEIRRLALAEFLATRTSIEAAEAALNDARRELPRSMKIRFALGTLYEGGRQSAKARTIYEEITKEEGIRAPGLEAQIKLASLDYGVGKRAEASARVEQVLKENPRAVDALLLQGRIALDRQAGKEAVQAFRSVLKDQPNLAEGYALLGQAYVMSGDLALGRESLEKAATLDPRQYGARRALAGLDAAEGKREDARSRLEALLKEEPKDLGALGLLFDLQLADRDLNLLDTTLLRLRDAGVNQVLGDLAEGSLHQARQEWDLARKAFERAAAAQPDRPAPLYALIRLDVARGKPAQAQARLEGLLAKQPDHPYAHGMLGELLLLRRDEAAAEREFRLATKLNKQWQTPWLDWAGMKLARRQYEPAIVILREALAANSRAEELRVLLATGLTETHQVEEAMKEYETVLSQNPASMVAANNLAALLTDYKGDRSSLERALALSRNFERASTNPFFLDTLGWTYVKLGQNHEGLRVIRLALAKAPEHPVLNYHLGMAYQKAGNAKDARRHLEKALNAKIPFAGAEDAKAALAALKS
jgi:tetratricopeptide (TPR) repeat protein